MIDPADVKRCQQVMDELLWLSCRTRPDLAHAVSLLSGLVTKCPQRVQHLASHIIGYVKETVDLALVYHRCDGQSDGDLRTVSDAPCAPQGLRGHQGILAMWGGALVQWESKRALSSTEAELIGYVDAITMGESLQVVLSILQNNAFHWWMMVTSCSRATTSRGSNCFCPWMGLGARGTCVSGPTC